MNSFQIWAPMPAGFDDGHLNLLAFDISSGRNMKAVRCFDDTLPLLVLFL